jgi:hypothetical protein
MNTRDPLNLKRGVVVKDPERFPLIRKAWDLLLTESYTPGEVLRTLNEEWGYRTRPTKRGGRQPLSPSCVYKMFRNPYYAGFVCMQGELGTGKHEPMVSMGEFAKAKEILKKHMKQAAQHHRFTYTGLMRCGYCGQQITAEAKILRNGDRWDTYHCADSRLRCTKRGLSHQKLEEKFVAALCRFAVDPDLVGEAERVIVEELETRETKRGDLVHQQQSALRSAEERIRKIEEMWIGGLITDASRYRDLVRVEIQAKNRSLQALEEANQEFSEMKANARAACAYLLLDFRSFRDRSDHQKREMVGALADVTFYGKDKRIRARIPKVLSEVIRFVNSLAMLLEPADLRSGTQKEPTYERSILFGGPEGVTIEPKEALKKPNGSGRRNGKRRCTNGIHVPDSLFAALAGPRFSGAVPPLKKQGRTGRVRLGKPLSVFLERDLVSLAGLGSGTSLVDGVIHEVEEADNPLEDLTGLTHG